jgi:hypothetical protein
MDWPFKFPQKTVGESIRDLKQQHFELNFRTQRFLSAHGLRPADTENGRKRTAWDLATSAIFLAETGRAAYFKLQGATELTDTQWNVLGALTIAVADGVSRAIGEEIAGLGCAELSVESIGYEAVIRLFISRSLSDPAYDKRAPHHNAYADTVFDLYGLLISGVSCTPMICAIGESSTRAFGNNDGQLIDEVGSLIAGLLHQTK